MDSRKSALDRLSLALALFKDYVEIQNGACLFDSNQLAEGLMADLLGLVMPWGAMKNLNAEVNNYPAIDLVSADDKVGVQVTSTRTIDKVKYTIEKFSALSPRPEALYILMICGRQDSYSDEALQKSVGTSGISFDGATHILDLRDVFEAAKSCTIKAIALAVTRLEAELGKRAFFLLGRFEKSADRVLQTLVAHNLRPSEMVEALKLRPGVHPNEITAPHALQQHLTKEGTKAIADEFNVPLAWLDGSDDHVGERYVNCAWRTLGGVKTIITEVIERYGTGTFTIVLPEDTKKPDGLGESTTTIGPVGPPVLVYYEAQGKYGTVFVHLGLQPWNVEHYQEAALTLWIGLRHVRDLLRFGAVLRLWPASLIEESTRRPLAELIPKVREAGIVDESRYAFHKNGLWQLPGRLELQADLNGDYLPKLESFVECTLREKEARNYTAEITQEIVGRRKIPAPAQGTGRIFSSIACDVAALCGRTVFCSDQDGTVHELTVSEARLVLDEQASHSGDEDGFPRRIIYLDVVPT